MGNTSWLQRLLTRLGVRTDAPIAMDTASDGTQSIITLLRAVLERIGETPADPDDALHTILGQRDATAASGVLTGASSVLALLGQIGTQQGLVFFGDVTGVTDLNNFESTDLAGREDDFFRGWWAMCVRDDGGGSAAPQGEYRLITDYTSVGGAIEHNSFSVIMVAGDQVQLIHPLLYEILTIRGGGETLQSLMDELTAMLDLAEVRTIASPVTLTGVVQYIYTDSPGTPFKFTGGFVNRKTGGWGGGESVTVNVEVQIDGATWIEIWTITFAAEPSPVLAAIPSHANSALLNIPFGFTNRGDGVRVGIVQTVEGAAFHTWEHSFLDEVRSS